MPRKPPAQYADFARARALSQGYFVSVDPGTRYPAAALWYRGELVVASRVPVPKLAQLDRVERCRRIAPLIVSWILDRLAEHAVASSLPVGAIAALAVEFQEIYRDGPRGAKQDADPNDLLLLACLAGAVAVELGVETISPLPKEWSMIPKREREHKDPWTSPRGRVLRSRLRAGEFERIQPTHDAVDAVGIGMKILCRLEPGLAGTT